MAWVLNLQNQVAQGLHLVFLVLDMDIIFRGCTGSPMISHTKFHLPGFFNFNTEKSTKGWEHDPIPRSPSPPIEMNNPVSTIIQLCGAQGLLWPMK